MISNAGSVTPLDYSLVYKYHLHREYVLLLEFCIHVFALLASVPRRRCLTLPGLVICVLVCLSLGLALQGAAFGDVSGYQDD